MAQKHDKRLIAHHAKVGRHTQPLNTLRMTYIAALSRISCMLTASALMSTITGRECEFISKEAWRGVWEELTCCSAVARERGKASCKVRRSILQVRSPVAHPSEIMSSMLLSRNMEVFRAAKKKLCGQWLCQCSPHPWTAPTARRLTVKPLLSTAAAPALITGGCHQ